MDIREKALRNRYTTVILDAVSTLTALYLHYSVNIPGYKGDVVGGPAQ